MRVEFLPHLDNVIRFPVELRVRPSLDLVREIAPDVREVAAVAQAYGFDELPHDLRERVDAETAAHIAGTVPRVAEVGVREAMLAELLDPMLDRAVAACRAATNVAIDAADARRRLLEADAKGGYWLEPLRERAEALSLYAATLLVEAHGRVEEAEGVARAVGLARRGEAWTPRDFHADTDFLLGVDMRTVAG